MSRPRKIEPKGSSQFIMEEQKGKKRQNVRIVAVEVSERKACSTLRLNRTAKKHKCHKSSDENELKEAIIRLASKYSGYGYRRITTMLKAKGWKVNHKRGKRM